jgi:hypothetical protein
MTEGGREQMRKPPERHEERKALHEKLMQFATIAAHDGATRGLAKFIGRFDDESFRNHLVLWLEKYTPVRREKNLSGNLLFRVPKDIRTGYDLGGARLNPYYTCEFFKSESPVAKVSAQRVNESTRDW